jgi:hypothetical protein
MVLPSSREIFQFARPSWELSISATSVVVQPLLGQNDAVRIVIGLTGTNTRHASVLFKNNKIVRRSTRTEAGKI